MELRPIMSTLLRHKTAATLIIMEIALACAILSNALFLVAQRADGMRKSSGIQQEDRVLTALLDGIGTQDDAEALTRADLQALRAIAGVQSATVTNQLPYYTRSSSNSGVSLKPDQPHQNLLAAQYMAREGFVQTLGLQLIAGRDFKPDEYQDESVARDVAPGTLSSVGIISKAMADVLFPGRNAIGQRFYIGDIPITVVGIVQTLRRPSSMGHDLDYSMVLPVRQSFDGNPYVLRIHDPTQAERIRAAAVATLERNASNRLLLEDKPYRQIHAEYFRNDRAMIWLLLTVCAAMLIVTALGIVGLASFWVQQRTRQIGIRRALGASRRQILRYFQIENFILASAGVLLGMLLAYAINQMLMQHYQVTRLPLWYLPVAAVMLWILGQVAVYWPARKAAQVPPALATRSA